MKVIMTGGGTGGHIYPAIAIADKIMERSGDSEILFVGTKKGLEGELVPKHGYPIKFITVTGLNRKNMLKNFKVLRDYNKGKKQAAKIIEEFQPDIVIGTGGYVCGPVVKVASSMGIKTYVQEQNAFPGLTNKMLEKNVENVFLGFEEAGRFFKYPDKHIVTGNPVRSEFFDINDAESRLELGLKTDQFMLLAFGGSQGAGRVNKAMLDVIKRYNDNEQVQVYFATGKAYYEPILSDLKSMGIHIGPNIHIIEYIDHMEKYLSACDLAVCRSGALTVSEIMVCGKPSILIPSPNVTGDHQTFNARAVSDKGGAIIMEESKLDGAGLYTEIERLRQDSEYLRGMAEQCRRIAPVDATDIIYYSLIT
ncbi:MAG: undecaprenyldiphospho-muramoylpentapeptide beta-N-acetylglucosaminyltransferase [Eubacteriaceae bacterium]|nr:undecaprenyldiphospho-muramoylpentapeptide beta-N-acetylglucosaminyltransferase [Eubacteriaceae bacterium]